MPQTIRGVMHEFKHGELHSGSSSGPVVKNRKQAIAIALSEQRQQGKSVPARASSGPKAGGRHPHKNLGGYLHPKKVR